MLAKIYRNQNLESQHEVDICMMDTSGKVTFSSGDLLRPVYPRSAIKMLQAIGILRSGAATKFSVTEQELATACASHSGQKEHVDVVANWLKRLSLQISDLKCGAHAPYDIKSQCSLLTSGQAANALHNNCSGKHTGILAMSMALEEDFDGYLDWVHPVQKYLRDILGEFCLTNFENLPYGIDGCGIPNYYAPLQTWCLGLSRFASQVASGETSPIFRAMIQNPLLTSGTTEFCYRAMQDYPGLAFKVGAEGVLFCCSSQFALTVKCRDGSKRAAEFATLSTLENLGIIPKSDHHLLRNWAGTLVGHITAY